jgi:hypothetical protein
MGTWPGEHVHVVGVAVKCRDVEIGELETGGEVLGDDHELVDEVVPGQEAISLW